MIVTVVSTSSKILSINHCKGENRTGNGTVMNLYRKCEGMYTYQSVLLLLHSFYIPPRYNWKCVQSSVKHHNPSSLPPFIWQITKLGFSCHKKTIPHYRKNSKIKLKYRRNGGNTDTPNTQIYSWLGTGINKGAGLWYIFDNIVI